MATIELKDLLEVLNQHGVKRYKTPSIEIEFGLSGVGGLANSKSSGAVTSHAEATAPDASNPLPTPEQMKANESMEYDKALFWSASPDPKTPKDHQETLPMTGDVPL